ncbi:MAG: hypothetical protein IKZ92_09980 [Muribaculaceae bacterium]|nr:hypothetical protein [Muribaculaceae bacterium]
MKRLLLVILFAVMALVAVVTGCGGARYDSRLAAADSLMHDHPDSALALVEAVSPASLTTDGDRAYRDLLLTQARYRCYITATSDSDINRALDYYRRHSGEREKLTRAYIYKGAVMEELGHPDSAMFYYKHAEVTANEKDYANLGQINTRIADLYRRYYGDEQTCFEKYQLAYHYHTRSTNKKQQLNSLYNMIMMNGITCQENLEDLYDKAYTLAEELGDSMRIYELNEMKCRQLSRNDTTHEEAKRLALDCLSDFSQYISNDLLLDLAYLYCMEDKTDSASMILHIVDENANPKEVNINIRKNEIQSIIARRQGDSAKSGMYAAQSSQLFDSIKNVTDKYSFEKIESDFNKVQHVTTRSTVNRLKWMVIVLSIIGVVFIVSFAALYFSRLKYTKTIIKELENTEINGHEDLFSQLDAQSTVIERLLNNLVTFMKSCAGIGMQCSTTETAQKIKEAIVNVANDDFWEELAAYIERHHAGVNTAIKKNPHLTKNEIRLIELACCGFSDLEIAIILGYSTSYVSNKRGIIASKMQIDMPLKMYLNILMKDGAHTNNY